MATPPVRQWGVTPPISVVLPTKDEIAANDDLIAELKAQNNFEQPTETDRRCVGIHPNVSETQAHDRIDRRYCNCCSASQLNSSKSSVATKVFLLQLWKRPGVRFSHMEVTDLESMDLVSLPYWIDSSCGSHHGFCRIRYRYPRRCA